MTDVINAAPEVRTDAGRLEGRSLGAVDAFLGIPYAAAPVGALRWRPPQPVTPWDGVRAATTHAASAWQAVAPEGFGPWTAEFVVSGPVSEDCLYLNVWAPAIRDAARCPVLVWIHGGAFSQGSGSVPIYDGRALASQGIVVVTINYRLGVLGFLAHPGLAGESATPAGYGNFGLQDQIAALRWVKANIANFGGDPDAVTVAGQSAGAMSVHMLVAAAEARGLFHRAIAQSGPPELVPIPSRADAEARGLAFAASLGQADLGSLRALRVKTLTQRLGPGPNFGPMVDGHLLPAWPPVARYASCGAPAPMIVGQTADENSGLDPAYASGTPAYRAQALERWLSALWRWAHQRGDPPAAPLYAYHFNHVMPGHEAERYGAFHTSDVPYALGTLGVLVQRPLTDGDHELGARMNAYWLDFIRTGNPNGPGRPQWPALDLSAPAMLQFGADIQLVPMFDTATFRAVRQRLAQGGAATVLG